ncbi:MAG: AmpG family muropeptide MFS transporter, partial [Pseudobdellovibrio sp.]
MSKSFIKDLLSKKMLYVFLLGFSSGLPFLLTSGTLKIWLTRENVDISTIGYFGWVGLSYSLKFIWAPLLDSFSFFGIGRRKSWLLITQVGLILLISLLGSLDPKVSLSTMAVVSVLVAFFSATQDIAIDAFRREYLHDYELGLGTSMNQYGSRIALLLAGGLGVSLVGDGFLNLSWNQLYYLIAGSMLIGVAVTLLIPEPEVHIDTEKSLRKSIYEPFKEFLARDQALKILFFVMLYKFGTAMGGAMLSPFYVQMGYSNEDIGLIAKMYGLIAALVGVFVGGVAVYKFGTIRSLWIFGFLQAISTVSFAIITITGPARWALAVTVLLEDISTGMGTAAFVTYLSTMTNKKFTATQYAILSSVATLGRNFFSGFSGDLVKLLGWTPFFISCGLMCIPGMVLLYLLSKKQEPSSF